MLSHEQIWQAIDRLASTFGYSPSGLAKQAGLDATSFNKSKRHGPDGKPRWPSTESISRILGATGATMSDFVSLVEHDDSKMRDSTLSIPVIGFAQAGTSGYFDEEGYPEGDAWNEVRFPDYNASNEDGNYALEIQGDSMEPLYRKGDIIVISPRKRIRKGDRIVLKTLDGEVMAKELVRQNQNEIEVRSLNKSHENREFSAKDIAWMGRVVWVSQ